MTSVLFIAAIGFGFACVGIRRWVFVRRTYIQMRQSRFSDSRVMESFLDELSEFAPMALTASACFMLALVANITSGELDSNASTAAVMVVLFLFTVLNMFAQAFIAIVRDIVRNRMKAPPIGSSERPAGYRRTN